MQSLQSDVDITNSSYLYLVRTQRIYFIFGNVFLYPGNKYNNNCFFLKYTENIALGYRTDLASLVVI